jgi:hypothetical protein
LKNAVFRIFWENGVGFLLTVSGSGSEIFCSVVHCIFKDHSAFTPVRQFTFVLGCLPIRSVEGRKEQKEL